MASYPSECGKCEEKEECDVHRYGTYLVEIGMCFQSSRGNWDVL